MAARRVEIECQPVVGRQAVQPGQVAHRSRGAEVLLVRLGQRRGVAAHHPFGLVLTLHERQQVPQVVTPATGDLGDFVFGVATFGRRRLRTGTHRDQQLHPRETHLDDAVVAADDLPGPVLRDHRTHRAARLRPESVGGEVHEHGDEVAVQMDPREDADVAVLGAIGDQLREPE